MNFLNPFALIGLAAASIPVILHLLNLRKLKTVEFSSLRFLKELQKTKIRKLKIKQIILLILRTLIIIFAVMAFARPTIDAQLPVMGQYAKMSTVLLLDNSFSMDISDETGNRYNNTKTQALNIIESMNEGDEGVIIPLVSNVSARDLIWSRNKSFLKEELSKVKISYTKANLNRGLSLAQKVLDESTNLNKQVFVLSDFQPNIFFRYNGDSVKYFDSNTLLYAVKTTGKSNGMNNLSVDSINVKTKIFRVNKTVDVEVFIKNNSDNDVENAIVSLYFNKNRVAQRTLDINAGEIKMLDISAPVENMGFVSAKIELEPDAFEADNYRYFGFIVQDKPDVAITGPKDEMDFVVMALKAGEFSEDRIRRLSIRDISSPVINEFDLIIVSLKNASSSDLETIRNYVKNSGSALLFAGENDDAKAYSGFINDMGLGNISVKEFSREKPSAFTEVDKLHPLFEGVFKGTTDRNIVTESPNIYKSMSASGGLNIIDISGGVFLNEVNYGEGKVLYCSVSPGGIWSDLPTTGFFPAMVFRSAFYLSAKQEYGKDEMTGSSVKLSFPQRFVKGNKITVIDPNGSEFYQPKAILRGTVLIDLGVLDIPGVYLIKDQTGDALATVSVNIPQSESTITFDDGRDILPILEDYLADKNMIEYTDEMVSIADIIHRAKTGTELWQLFIMLAIITGFVEMLVARNKKADTQE